MTTNIIDRIAALAVGRIEFVTAAELRIALFEETPQATALNTGVPIGFPRINAYILVPNEAGAVVAAIKEIAVARQYPGSRHQDEALVDLPFPARTLIATPFGTLLRDGEDHEKQTIYKLERGVPVLPSVGDPVLLPTAMQLRSIVEAPTADRLVQIGTAPFAGNAKVWVHPDKLFGRHLAILGNTGSGKSCSVAGIVRWSLEAVIRSLPTEGPQVPNARFIILDPNGEYTEAFKDGSLQIRRYAVGGAGGARPLVVPGWLWNGQEWAAFTAAQPGVQRPLLLRALRLLRNEGSVVATVRAQAVRRYHSYYRQIEQLYADVPQSVSGFPRNKSFAEMLEGLVGLTRSDETLLSTHGAAAQDLLDAIKAVRDPIERVRQSRTYVSGGRPGYNDFQPGDLTSVLETLKGITEKFPVEISSGEISEDAPVRFRVSALPDRIHEVALATGGQALANVEPLINRIQVMLGDTSLRRVIDSTGTVSLETWLSELLGPTTTQPESLAIVDLSLVPSDVVHIAVAVISRLVFESLQRHLKLTGDSLPTVLVLEEAHSFVRRESEQGANTAAADLCRQTFERIAREGRKFGLGLMLASQRPSELSPTVLAQCNSFLLHRIVNDVDQNLVRRLVPDALGGLLGELPTLPSQQAILLGWAVTTPVLVRIRDLTQRPRSDDPAFWATWRHTQGRPPDWPPIAREWEQANPATPEGESHADPTRGPTTPTDTDISDLI